MRLLVPVLLVLLLPAATGCGRNRAPGDAPREDKVLSQVEPAASPREQVENPLYTNWADFKPGTSVVYRAVTQEKGHEAVTTTTTTYTLLERTDEQVSIEMKAFTKRYDGVEIDNPPQKLTNLRRVTLPPGAKASEFGKAAGVLERGEETVKAAGRDYPTVWQKSKGRNEAGEVLVTTWTSDAVPGKLIRSVTHTPAIGKTTTTELVEVKTP